MNSEKIAISVKEAADLFGVSRPTMYEILRRKDCNAAFKVGTRTLVHKAKLEAWAAKQAEGNRV